MNNDHPDNHQLNGIIEMIGSMASLDFSKRLAVENPDDPIQVVAYGLNMLSEELEANVIRKTILEETNANLERFAFTVAHDIKSPVSTAIGLLSLIEGELKDRNNDSLKEYVALLQKLCDQIIAMVTGILEYSRTNFEKNNIVPIDLNAFFNDLRKNYILQSNVDISINTTLPEIHYNEIALRQIISNLINNAIKHNDKDVCHLAIQCKENDAYYEIVVKDNGPGIKPEDQKKIFDLFENINSTRHDSYGIGLSIVKKLVTQANGSVWIDSEPGRGSSFVFTIEKNRASEL